MPGVTPILWTHKKNAKGLSPIYLRIQAAGKTRYVSLRLYVRESRWNEKKARVRSRHKDAAEYNSIIANRVAQAEEEVLKLKAGEERVTAGALKQRVKRDVRGDASTCYLTYADTVIDQFERQGKLYTAERYGVLCRKLENFAGRPLPFDRFTPAFLREYETHLIEHHENKRNTVASNFRGIRAILYRAIRDGLVEQAKNPFFQFKIKQGEPQRDKLSLSEVKVLEALELEPGSLSWHVRNYFMFSFYCAGIRFGDMARMRCHHIQNGRLVYTMHKTGKKKSIKLLLQAQKIVDEYLSNDRDAYLFPMLTSYDTSSLQKEKKAISSQNALVNKYLRKLAAKAGIESKVSFHVSRHSFADIARQNGWDVYDISKALGHSNLKATENYLKGFDADGLDNKMETLLGKP